MSISNEKGVVINGITWATCNVGRRGEFVDSPEDYGEYYTFEKAEAACPNGWRLPTADELESLADAGSIWTNENGVGGRLFGNRVFLPAAGYYSSGAGKIVHSSTKGSYWSSTQNYSNNIFCLDFNCDIWHTDFLANVDFSNSIRCVKDNTQIKKTQEELKQHKNGIINGIVASLQQPRKNVVSALSNKEAKVETNYSDNTQEPEEKEERYYSGLLGKLNAAETREEFAALAKEFSDIGEYKNCAQIAAIIHEQLENN